MNPAINGSEPLDLQDVTQNPAAELQTLQRRFLGRRESHTLGPLSFGFSLFGLHQLTLQLGPLAFSICFYIFVILSHLQLYITFLYLVL